MMKPQAELMQRYAIFYLEGISKNESEDIRRLRSKTKIRSEMTKTTVILDRRWAYMLT